MLICDDEPMAGPVGPFATDRETATLFTYVYNDPVNRIDPSGQQTPPQGLFGVSSADVAALALQAEAEARKRMSDYRRQQLREMHARIKLDLQDAEAVTRLVKEGGFWGTWARAEDVEFEGENFKLIWVFGGNDPSTNRPTVVVGAAVPAPRGAESDRAAAQEWFDHRNEELKSAAFTTLKEVAILAVPEIWALRAARNVRSAARAAEVERAAIQGERAANAVRTAEEAAVVGASVAALTGRVAYGESELSKIAIAFRQTEKIAGARNVAVFEYLDASGTLRTIARASERGVGHAERIIARELETVGVKASQVRRIYSELQPCVLPFAQCEAFIAKNFPQALVTWSFDYGATVESRAAGVALLREAVRRLGFTK
jgi:hypothetical protein